MQTKPRSKNRVELEPKSLGGGTPRLGDHDSTASTEWTRVIYLSFVRRYVGSADGLIAERIDMLVVVSVESGRSQECR